MQRFNSFFLGLAVFCLLVLPLVALAQFKGPSAIPPLGNVPGVIWNTKGTVTAQDAEINIAGQAKVNTLTTAPNIVNNILGKNLLQDGKRFEVNAPGAATYGMSNWDGLFALQKPLTFTINGDLSVDRVDPFIGPGNEGRIEARKYCILGLSGSTCISSWPSTGEGVFVKKTGDTMSGMLSIDSSSPGGMVVKGASGGATFLNKTNLNQIDLGSAEESLYVRGGNDGTSPAARIFVAKPNMNAKANGLDIHFPASSNGIGITIGRDTGGPVGGFEPAKGIVSYANKVGGEFWGTDYGVDAKSHALDSSLAGSGVAIRGSNGNVGGDFSGSLYGIKSYGGAIGGLFTNSAGSEVDLAYSGYGVIANVGPTNYGLFTDGIIYTSSNISAPNNTADNCEWVDAPSDDAEYMCPTTKFMVGIGKKRSVVGRIRCCNL